MVFDIDVLDSSAAFLFVSILYKACCVRIIGKDWNLSLQVKSATCAALAAAVYSDLTEDRAHSFVIFRSVILDCLIK